jgi:hypothetical protein
VRAKWRKKWGQNRPIVVRPWQNWSTCCRHRAVSIIYGVPGIQRKSKRHAAGIREVISGRPAHSPWSIICAN